MEVEKKQTEEQEAEETLRTILECKSAPALIERISEINNQKIQLENERQWALFILMEKMEKMDIEQLHTIRESAEIDPDIRRITRFTIINVFHESC